MALKGADVLSLRVTDCDINRCEIGAKHRVIKGKR